MGDREGPGAPTGAGRPERPERRERRRARQLGGEGAGVARATARLAVEVAAAEREEERRADQITQALDRAVALSPAGEEAVRRAGLALTAAPGGPGGGDAAARTGLLIINTKSGPQNNSILHVRELVALLASYGVEVEVRVKLRKKQARREARRAARAGVPLVIAAGGDGTVEAVAAGLVGTDTVLGIIPLGTYNNVAGCLGIPADPGTACALIGLGVTRSIDVGRVRPLGRPKGRIFLEMAAVGVTAALMPAGQGVKQGAWAAAAQILPAAVAMSATPTTLVLDGQRPGRQINSLLVEVANAPRMGPALTVAPDARMDDGLLDVLVYRNIDQAGLATRLVALKTGASADDDRIEESRARRVDVRTATPLPVMADSKVVGTTPASFEVLAGALRVIAGHGPGLSHPVSEALLTATSARARALVPVTAGTTGGRPNGAGPAGGTALAPPPGRPFAAGAAAALGPVIGRAMALAGQVKTLAAPAALVAAGVAAVPLARAMARGLRR